VRPAWAVLLALVTCAAPLAPLQRRAPAASDAFDSVRPACVAVDLPQLLSHLRLANKTQVLFFSTWCAECEHHLAEPQSLLVGVFDTPQQVQAALDRAHYAGPCLLDGGAAASLGLATVPARFVLHNGALQRTDVAADVTQR
jgi:hypothetical protein